MKTQIIITILAVFVYMSANSATISISKKNSNDPSDVCNNSIYLYVTSITGAPSGYTVTWIKANADIQEQSTSEAKVKWTATSAADGYIGTIKAQLKNSSGTILATSNTITVTIKSILHLEPNLTPYTNGTTALISPCSAGQVSLEVTKLEIPGTGIFPEKIYNYMWTLPAGWSANGITSTGSNEIPGGSNITATYPASSTSGTIKVKGYEAIIGCDDATPQSSKYATATINRNVTLTLTANKTYFLCGDTNPITYTVTANPAIPCALYYWNNSSTATTSNTFQKVPGLGNEIVTVTVIYGTSSVSKTITVPVKTFKGAYPPISGETDICSTPQEYTIAQIQPGYTVDWNCSSNLTPVNENNDHATFAPLSSGSGYIDATVYTPCGDIVPLARKQVWVGAPPTPTIQSLNVCGSTPIEINASSIAPVNYYNWTISCGTLLSGQGTSNIMVQPNCNCYEIYVRLQTQNDCNTSSQATKYITIDCTGITPLSVILFPNPATSETTVSLETSGEENNLKSGSTEVGFDENEEWELAVYNENQMLKENKTNLKGRNTKISTKGWKEGVYIVRVKYKSEILQEKLVVTK